jgi:hypothetical protein
MVNDECAKKFVENLFSTLIYKEKFKKYVPHFQQQEPHFKCNCKEHIEDHHLLQPCAGEPHFKCNCKEHFQYAVCPHSNLVKMLWFPECQVSEDYSVALIPSRHKQRRPGVFATVSAEPTFQDKESVRRSWNPSGMTGEKMSIPDSDDDDFEESAPSKGRKKRKAHLISCPSKLQVQQQDAQLPARIAAMSEPDRYSFQDWLPQWETVPCICPTMRSSKYSRWKPGNENLLYPRTLHILLTPSSSQSPRYMLSSNFNSKLLTAACWHDSAFGPNCLGSCISEW